MAESVKDLRISGKHVPAHSAVSQETA